MKKESRLTFWESLIIMLVMFGLLGTMMIKLKMTPQIPILLTFTLLLFYGKFRGFSWNELQQGIIDGVKPGIIPMIIFIMIGVLVAAWLMSGVIPTIMVYGLELLNARFFLFTVFVSCCLVGVIVGSSFTTISTLGIVFMGIGHVMDINVALTAGSIVSGALFGNNMSPLSGTTNLSTGIAGVDNVFDHIKTISHTALPSAIIAAIIFLVAGHTGANPNMSSVHHIINALQSNFFVSPWMLIPIAVLIICAVMQVPAIPTLLSGSIVAIVMHIFIDHPSFSTISNQIMLGYKLNSPDKKINAIVSGGGVSSMLDSISLILVALTLGGVLLKLGVVDNLIGKLKEQVNTPGKLILTSIISAIGVNFLVGEQYISIILPGTTFRKNFEEQHINPEYLSRVLATGGADINALVPWGVSGIFISGILGVSPLVFIPFAFYVWLNPLLTVIFGFVFGKNYKTDSLASRNAVENVAKELD
ncbi:Na+/H+ antiporter NhaC [Companilactobacillus sp.]|uniref:Na+/H+ antiporter NhaC n=1 Tax=Companilactobacillus sp. TaxID=2767905 RepID=UPI0025B8270D|nr:Na+/H+ antiporter NhaC [Companilactobacillus sp.]MCH4008377.1 Na+/H+ antiporter NhaC [Companilactobacillus sp.]MCH4051444.1 Na+/H+ antiporter NhaC [Companilactobacillus sp.]MCH4076320.1 Na+/H+ antiporter NhaC [Companilactobacillus sp.]MCH4124895.1 Na+/H+ antiporter NhaC [Companilactobacillus sp.]MCH4131437.1 Na+/H+ antiporter NhaC [Companilactobacillus sp.]